MEQCSLCKTDINEGATVCTGCGAVKTTRGEIRKRGSSQPLPGGCLIVSIWLFFGPLLVVIGFASNEKGTWLMSLLGLAVTVGGVWIVKKIVNHGSELDDEVIWVRH